MFDATTVVPAAFNKNRRLMFGSCHSCGINNVFLAAGREPSGIANDSKHRRARALPLRKVIPVLVSNG